MAIVMGNLGMLKGIFDGIYNTGSSLRGGKNLQEQIAESPVNALKAKIIPGWKDSKGKEYSTSIADHMVYMANADARQEAELAAIKALLQQVVTMATKGVDVQIDYAKIDASIKAAIPEMPEYELVKKEETK